MAFNSQNLALIWDSLGGGLFRLWAYKSDDSQATITTAGYFASAGHSGVKANVC